MMTYTSPARARYLSDLSPAMAKGLMRCHGATVVVSRGFPTYGISVNTGAALVRHTLIDKAHDKRSRWVWKPTSRGLGLIMADEPRLLASRSQYGYTAEPAQALLDEPEAPPAAVVEQFARVNRERFEAVRAGADERLFDEQRSLEQRLHLLKRVALERGIDTRSELRLVERALDALERKIRTQRV